MPLLIVTFDGVRSHEMLSGPSLVHARGSARKHPVRCWAFQDRKQAAWELTPQVHQICGGVHPMRITNPAHISEPGYLELYMGTGAHGHNTNDCLESPPETLLDELGRQGAEVRVYSSWKTFQCFLRMEVSAGEAGEDSSDQETMARVFGDIREGVHPDVLCVHLGDTDTRAHHGEYGGYLEALQYCDCALGRLWGELQGIPKYRDKTVMVVTADHGRGSDETWTDHGGSVRDSEKTWFAHVGGDPGQRPTCLSGVRSWIMKTRAWESG